MNTKDEKLEQQVSAFCEQWQGLDLIYEDYARSVGLPYTTLYILTMIKKTPDCTQKKIREKTFLPKQTVNSVVTGFYKKGYVALRELPEDRRNKTIHLTAKGKAWADKIVPQIHKAEVAAMASLPEAEREQLITAIRHYGEAFRKAMKIN